MKTKMKMQTQTKAKATPLHDWQVIRNPNGNPDPFAIKGPDNVRVADVADYHGDGAIVAAAICAAVNHHAAMVSALRQVSFLARINHGDKAADYGSLVDGVLKAMGEPAGAP